MDKKNPFRTAINELMGSEPGAAAATVQDNLAQELAPQEPGEGQGGNTVEFRGQSGPSAFITEDVVIDGSITVGRNMVFAGTIKGNVKCEGKLTVQGRVEGDITAVEVEMVGARVRGKTVCQGHLSVDAGSLVVGNVESDELLLAGKDNGDIHVNGMADIRGTALLVGDLEFGSVAVEQGAVLTGKVTTKTDENPSAIFSELM